MVDRALERRDRIVELPRLHECRAEVVLEARGVGVLLDLSLVRGSGLGITRGLVELVRVVARLGAQRERHEQEHERERRGSRRGGRALAATAPRAQHAVEQQRAGARG